MPFPLTRLFLAVFINSTAIHCEYAPPVESVSSLAVSVVTKDNYRISQKRFELAFVEGVSIASVSPAFGDLVGGYPFALIGNFADVVEFGLQQLLWGDVDIVDSVTSITETKISGVVPPSVEEGRANIVLIVDEIEIENKSVFFRYSMQPINVSCFPYSGHSTGETLLQIYGENFEDTARCVYEGLTIIPLRVTNEHIVCAMPEHVPTAVQPVMLDLWGGDLLVDSGCTFFYYQDVIINSIRPDHFSIHAHDNGVQVEIRGLHFREDGSNSLQVRVGEQICED